jgi:dipeptidyl aminopeptidase/acylaminoacyl peptidase
VRAATTPTVGLPNWGHHDSQGRESEPNSPHVVVTTMAPREVHSTRAGRSATIRLVRSRHLLLGTLPLALVACGGGANNTLPKPAEQHLVYVAGESPATASVWVANVDGSHPQRLTRGSVAVLTPDGKAVAVQRRDGIYVVPSHGGAPRKLTSQRLEPRGWSPDGKTLVATKSTQQAVVALVLIDRATGKTRTLAHGSLYGFDFSPKGDQLVYARAPQATEAGICGDLMDLYIADVGGGKPTQLTHNGFSAFPVWGPSKIAFSRFPQSFDIQDCAAPGVWTIDPKPGSKPEAIVSRAPTELSVSGDYGLQPLDWLDGGHLLVGVRTDFGTQGAELDASSHKLRQLKDYAQEASRDGQFYVGSGGEEGVDLTIVRVSDDKRVFRRRDACCPDWNR